MGMALGTRTRPRRRGAHPVSRSPRTRRLGRISLLALVFAVVLDVFTALGSDFDNRNFFVLFYAYMVFAVWVGDLWESLGAAAIASAATLWMMHTMPTWWHYSQWTLPGFPTDRDWFFFVAIAFALVALAQRWRMARGHVPDDAAAPMMTSGLENPVFVVQGHAQIIQGGGVVFDTRLGHHGPEGEKPVRPTPPDSPTRERPLE